MIDNNNYELWLLRYAEGELSAVEREAVEVWLADHPGAAEELALYNEAPRLEADKSIHYKVPVRPLWPAVMRWSAVAAVMAALMVPALRMGTMDTLESPAPLLANAVDTKYPTVSTVSRDSRDTKSHNLSENKINEAQAESTAALSDSIEPEPEQTIMEVNTLIAFEMEESGDTLYTTALITYESPTDWGDALLAANDAFHEDLSARPLGRFVSRQLPDSRRLKEKVVEPLREKIDNVKSIIK